MRTLSTKPKEICSFLPSWAGGSSVRHIVSVQLVSDKTTGIYCRYLTVPVVLPGIYGYVPCSSTAADHRSLHIIMFAKEIVLR